jgi:hypothetical protein
MTRGICIECKSFDNYFCTNPQSPVTDYVDGRKQCFVINLVGQCDLWEKKEDPREHYIKTGEVLGPPNDT